MRIVYLCISHDIPLSNNIRGVSKKCLKINKWSIPPTGHLNEEHDNPWELGGIVIICVM
jgi:hypothetical protein